MEKYENRIRKNKQRKRRNAILSVFSLLLLFSFGFFIGGKMSHKKSNVVVSAANNNQKEQEKKATDENMNSRESKVNTDNKSSDGKGFDPYKSDGKKVAYLTFDDGPSANNTPKILDILKSNNIKATFFVIGQCAEQNSELLKRENEEGHTIGNHTYSHNMKYVYSSPDNFINDLEKGDKVIKSIIGSDYNLKLIRFPGGSFGTKLAPYREASIKAGYHYVDWNDLTGDAEHNNVPVNSLLNELKKYTTQEHVVILMHDAPAKTTTVQALPQVIEYLKSKGYTFETLK
ncbi:polysaccharide deacetylase family protein [Clostridium thailandense]|uniref:Polysaccharide deacetylase n=1 Tax=Clostridium thailandense TaxID=2794346 RepID=A0A949U329_9CLOT|nr:polysaccharide deacetylase family protein [Clostridium thailandense]MBV7275474.1 polysaccharide deacetylase [Clostridium thailandense]MCH5136664.1 polysaccharide deacetylase [Clostridiaceae bacterium UIB06]